MFFCLKVWSCRLWGLFLRCLREGLSLVFKSDNLEMPSEPNPKSYIILNFVLFMLC